MATWDLYGKLGLVLGYGSSLEKWVQSGNMGPKWEYGFYMRKWVVYE